ncbi:hypothetical protein EST38_g12483 [Candolleomyces aberdarensis]|uniref:Uncharacterized protein n=1 Tax=Candolleomyces aberdarensis TaxID=2316362 RepID=A0A4Q2D3F6_9AGAR|nr:hypothetical protein EST38_g12483 [Candolleomyces aberdarensis]
MTFNNNGNSTNVTNLNPVEQYERHRGRHHSPPPSWGASPQNPYGQQRANYSTAPYASNYGTGGPNLSAFVPNIDPDAYASFKRSCAQYYRAVGVPYLADVLMYDANRPPPSYGHYQ